MTRSKAQTLLFLQGRLKKSAVLELAVFSYADFQKDAAGIVGAVLAKFSAPLIVRSSSVNEDAEHFSNAGAFESVLNVAPNAADLKAAIERVFASYKNPCAQDEVFVQEMLTGVGASGVIFTLSGAGAPYYTVNYSQNGDTTSVTAGGNADLKTFVCYKDHTPAAKDLARILDAARELESVLDNPALDIEFAVCDERVFILQARSLAFTHSSGKSALNLDLALSKLSKKIEKLSSPHPKLLGKRSIFGVMPDWNPAEIIGLRPKKLALSLYKEFITDEIWAYQRDNYGYRNLRSFPLLVSFFGIPYIDVRVSFNSFLPKNLHENIAEKLVEYYLDELAQNAHLHDKVEFEIVFSCYFFGISGRLERLRSKGFSANEIKRIEFALLDLTNSILAPSGHFQRDLEKIALLDEKFSSVMSAELPLIDTIYWLTEDCKRYGTLAFAGLARAAFIATQILNSFVSEGIISAGERAEFLASINTVSKTMNKDFARLEKDEFLKLYGHLRPNTYDIISPRYDEDYDRYFGKRSNGNSSGGGGVGSKNTKDFAFSPAQLEQISAQIVENGLKTSAAGLVKFIKDAIEAREYSKFLFTRHLSQVISLLGDLGAKSGIGAQDLAFLDFAVIKNLYSTLEFDNLDNLFLTNIKQNKEAFEFTKALQLPSLITKQDDIYEFFVESGKANFIGLASVTAGRGEPYEPDLAGKIVCIKNADPGYDFLFGKGIAGLITCYGGANSHMAVRCAELGLPAAIGCGEPLFAELARAELIELDCLRARVKALA